MSNLKRASYVKSGLLYDKSSSGSKNEITVENEKKVRALAEHMLGRLLDLEKLYSITKRRLENEREIDSKPTREPALVAPATKGFFYELAYETYEDKTAGHEYVRLTLMPDMFRVRTNNSTRLQQHSDLYADLESELEQAHSFFYASRISDALNDAMSRVGNARKYAIDGYLADEQAEDLAKQLCQPYAGNTAQGNWSTQNEAEADADYYYGEEEGI